MGRPKKIKYWDCGDGRMVLADHSGIIDVAGIVDDAVGDALRNYVVESGNLWLSWSDEPEPNVEFNAGETAEFGRRISLLEIIKAELESNRPWGQSDDEFFYEPKGDRRVILLQALLQTYLDWRAAGVHIPAKR